MRSLAIAAAIAAVTMLAGCGSTGQSAAPVESSADAGDVARSDLCPPGPPADSRLREMSVGRSKNDGVVGAIYNDTPGPVWVVRPDSGNNPCQLEPGKGAAFAGMEFITLRVSSGSHPADAYSDIRLVDPFVGWPTVTLSGPSRIGTSCPTKSYDASRLREGSTADLGDPATSGQLQVVRLDDNADVARQWSGSDSAGDWPRIDVRITSTPAC